MPIDIPPDGLPSLCECGPCRTARESVQPDFFAPSEGQARKDASDLDLAELWPPFRSSYGSGYDRQDDFSQFLRKIVTDPSEIDDLGFCEECRDPGWNDDLYAIANGSITVCESCRYNFPTCHQCDDQFPSEDMVETLRGPDICENCRINSYSFCDDCDGYYHDDDADEHEHDDSDGNDGCCESPVPVFAIRNDGCEPLSNDTRATIALPAGTITDEGIEAIRYYLIRQGGDLRTVAWAIDQLGNEWQTRNGNYTKRLSRFAYQTYKFKISPDVLSQVGCIAREHSTAVDVEIDITRDLNQSASDFYHSDSCWWSCYSASRCALKTNGGFGLRSFSSYESVSGRAWVMPLRKDENGQLTPTFDTVTPNAFVVFNGYGDLGGYVPARIIAHMVGWTYRKIGFTCEPMWTNAGGYLIAPEDIASKFTDSSLSLAVPQHSNLYNHEKHEKELVTA